MGATLTFNIYSDRNVSGVKLYAKLATEIIQGGFVITPEGDFGYQFIVNGESMNYGSVDLTGLTPAAAGQGPAPAASGPYRHHPNRHPSRLYPHPRRGGEDQP